MKSLATSKMESKRPQERGGVLLTVLLLITVMATVAVALVDDIRFGIRRTESSRLSGQAQWYAFGAEDLAKEALKASWRANPGRTTLNDLWAQGPTVFPVDGGVIEGQISDYSNCFNLNNLVEPDGNARFIVNTMAQAQFRNLLAALDFTEGDTDSLANTAIDWLDSDTVPSPGGAEDAYYLGLEPPYRTANTLMAHVTELRALRGFSEDVFQRILPFICALPHTDPSQINVNTLTEVDGPLLRMLAGPDLDPIDARQIIRDRPRQGFRSLAEFWSHRSFAGRTVSAIARDQVSIRTRYFFVRANVALGQAYVSIEAILEQGPSGEVRRVSRRMGALL